MCFIHVCAWRPGNNTESPVLLFPSSLQCLSLNLEQSWWASHPSGPPVLAKLALVTGIFTTSTGYRCEYHQQGLQVWAPPALVTSGNTTSTATGVSITSTGYRYEHHQHGLQVCQPQPGFYAEAGHLNSCSHVYVPARILTGLVISLASWILYAKEIRYCLHSIIVMFWVANNEKTQLNWLKW